MPDIPNSEFKFLSKKPNPINKGAKIESQGKEI